jgi:branched-chain amino acid transport system substrate-binding protein
MVAAFGYDSATIILTAMQKANSTDVEKVRAAMEGITVEAVTGRTMLDKQHNPVKPGTVTGIKGGARAYVSTVSP